MKIDILIWHAGSTLKLSRSCLKVKVIDQSSRSAKKKVPFKAMDAVKVKLEKPDMA